MAGLHNDFTSDFIQKLFDKIDELTSIVTGQTAVIADQIISINELTETVAKLSVENAALKEQLSKNSKNSSKPPSSDGLKKPSPKSLRKPSGKKQGAQEGHKGKGFSITQAPDEIIQHLPAKCIGCSNAGKCTSCGITDTRYEVDIRIDTKVTAHQSLSFACQKENGRVLTGTFPANITGTMQYGNNLEALTVSLNTVGMMGIKRTHDILSAVFGIPISTGTICSMVKSCAEKLTDTVEKIRTTVISLPLAHFDETGTRVDKKTYWFHNASNEDFTYLTVEEKRGTIGMNSSGVLPDFQGIAVHDCWKSYWSYEAVTHAICCAHLLRELTGVSENHPEQLWADKMKKLLLCMKKVRDTAVDSGKKNLSYYYLNGFYTEYDRIIKEAREQNPIKEKQSGQRGRQAKGKLRALVERLAEYK
ncbi:MAG: transposase, partial [Firmicutes bacterium]|nr:transposase [Bacillota bacterium]